MKKQQAKREFGQGVKNFLVHTGLIVLTCCLFTLSFPSIISYTGFSFLAFFALIPAFYVVHKASWKAVWFYGWFFGLLAYAMFNYWLVVFHALSIYFVTIGVSVYTLVMFLFLKAACSLDKRYVFLFHTGIWVIYEFVRTLGFLGYPFGFMGYTQYRLTPFIQISSIFAVWGVSFLVILPSAFIGQYLALPKSSAKKQKAWYLRSAGIIAGVLILNTLIGLFMLEDYSDYDDWNIALLQHDVNPRESEYVIYQQSLDYLLSLSSAALSEDLDAVLWPETAVVPSINWHAASRHEPRALRMIDRLMNFSQETSTPIITGNSDRSVTIDAQSNSAYQDYNATILIQDGAIQDIYHKVRLVPMSEHFPYKKLFPWVAQLMDDYNFVQWEAGTDLNVFNLDGVLVGTPICYEDGFGYISRGFANNGADVIANIANLRWSESIPMQYQHLAGSVFRAVENRRSVVRSATSGITCSIDPSGRILAELPPFSRDYLVTSVPLVSDKQTVYSHLGEWFPAFLGLIILAAFLQMAISACIQLKKKANAK